MPTPKLISFLILVIFHIVFVNCESIRWSIPPNVPHFYPPVPATSPSYSDEVEPNYNPGPASNSYPAIPYPAIPASPISSRFPLVPAPEPIPELAPHSRPPEPASSPPYPNLPVYPARGIKAAYWPSFDGFPASSIDISYFTHLYYAFLLPEPGTYKLNVTSFDQEKIPEFIGALHARNPPIKTLLAIGGAGNDPTVFSKMVSTDTTRAIFIESSIEIARNYEFDGVDLDWEFPADDTDMSNLALLYKEWRAALVKEAKASQKTPLLLTSAVYFSSKFSGYGEARSYPAMAISKYVDWVSPMCFDYHGKWENYTGLNAALYDPNTNISSSFGIGSWIQAGVAPKKLVMGLPLYGRTWRLQNPNVNGVGAPAVGVGPGDDGILNYNQILDFNRENGATVVFDSQVASYYSYAGDYWIGYDDVQSIKLKIQFARARGLGGYFFWALGQDKDWIISRQASSAWGR